MITCRPETPSLVVWDCPAWCSNFNLILRALRQRRRTAIAACSIPAPASFPKSSNKANAVNLFNAVTREWVRATGENFERGQEGACCRWFSSESASVTENHLIPSRTFPERSALRGQAASSWEPTNALSPSRSLSFSCITFHLHRKISVPPTPPRHPLSINSTAAVCVSCLSAIKTNANDGWEPRPHNIQLLDRVADNYHDNMIRETKEDWNCEETVQMRHFLFPQGWMPIACLIRG